MVDFSGLQLTGREPVYQQIAAHLKGLLLQGRTQAGEAMPSRRELAVLLGLNPNTVQKAYRLLEEEGLISTPKNAASIVCCTPERLAAIKAELNRQLAAELAQRARENGLSFKELVALLAEQWAD